MSKLVNAATFFTAMAVGQATYAETLMSCPSPEGKRYAMGVGWIEDGYTGGKFELIQDGSEFDIFVTDVAGTRSAKADGATVVPTEVAENAITLVVAYPRALETYLFDFETEQMIFTSMKISVGPKSAAVFFAACE